MGLDPSRGQHQRRGRGLSRGGALPRRGAARPAGGATARRLRLVPARGARRKLGSTSGVDAQPRQVRERVPGRRGGIGCPVKHLVPVTFPFRSLVCTRSHRKNISLSCDLVWMDRAPSPDGRPTVSPTQCTCIVAGVTFCQVHSATNRGVQAYNVIVFTQGSCLCAVYLVFLTLCTSSAVPVLYILNDLFHGVCCCSGVSVGGCVMVMQVACCEVSHPSHNQGQTLHNLWLFICSSWAMCD